MANNLRNVSPDEQQTAYHKVLSWFFAYPTKEFTLNEISRAVGVAKTSASTAVKLLHNEDVLILEKLGNLWRIKANQAHPFFITRKIPANLMLVYESGILEEVNRILPGAKVIILFGSYRYGDDNHESDIDIAVEVLGDKEMEVIKLGVIKQLGYRENVTVNLHVYSRSKIDINVFTSIVNGIKLDGLLEVSK